MPFCQMSFNLVFDNLKKMREDAEYIIRMLKEHEETARKQAARSSGPTPSSPAGGGRIRLYRIRLDEEDSRLVSDKLRRMGKAIAELQPLLLPKGSYVTRDEFSHYAGSIGEHVEKVNQSFKSAYDDINSIVQGQPDLGLFYSLMNEFYQDILSMERKVKEIEALTLDAPDVQDSYVQRAVESGLAKMEDEKTKVRQKIFLRADSEGRKLHHAILYAEQEKERHESLGRLMYLAGFDYEIYFHLRGNLDVLVHHVSERTGILIESTTSKPLKDKVDQVVARKIEYVKYFEEILGSNPRIHPLLVTIHEKPDVHPEARTDAMQNGVSIFTRKQIEELLNLLNKGKLNRRKIVDMILKNIPT